MVATTTTRNRKVKSVKPQSFDDRPSDELKPAIAPLAERVRSCLTDTDASWDWWSEDVREVVMQFLNCRKPETAGDRYDVFCAVNRCLPPASRCTYTQSQQELLESKLQHPIQLAKRIGKRFDKADGANTAHFGAINALLDFYRAAWKKFEAWEKKQSKSVAIAADNKQPVVIETPIELITTEVDYTESLESQDDASCDRCIHQQPYECAEGTAFDCKLGHIKGVMTGGVIAESMPSTCNSFKSANVPPEFPLTEGQIVLHTEGTAPVAKTIQKIKRDRFGNWRIGFQHADPKFADRHPVDWLQISANFTSLADYGIALPDENSSKTDTVSESLTQLEQERAIGEMGIKGQSPHAGVQPPTPQLEQERDRLINESELAPEGAWIQKPSPTSTRVFWRASKPIFDGAKVKFIGEENSPEHEAAKAALARRKQYEQILEKTEGSN